MSYVDPSIVPSTQRQREVLAEIKKRGLTLHRLHAEGSAVRLIGPGVYVTASAFGVLMPADLEPASPDRQRPAGIIFR